MAALKPMLKSHTMQELNLESCDEILNDYFAGEEVALATVASAYYHKGLHYYRCLDSDADYKNSYACFKECLDYAWQNDDPCLYSQLKDMPEMLVSLLLKPKSPYSYEEEEIWSVLDEGFAYQDPWSQGVYECYRQIYRQRVLRTSLTAAELVVDEDVEDDDFYAIRDELSDEQDAQICSQAIALAVCGEFVDTEPLAAALAMDILLDDESEASAAEAADIAMRCLALGMEFSVASLLYARRSINKDHDRALQIFKTIAEEGHPEAEANCGLVLYQVSRLEEAIPFLVAAVNYAKLHEDTGVVGDFAQARLHYCLADAYIRTQPLENYSVIQSNLEWAFEKGDLQAGVHLVKHAAAYEKYDKANALTTDVRARLSIVEKDSDLASPYNDLVAVANELQEVELKLADRMLADNEIGIVH